MDSLSDLYKPKYIQLLEILQTQIHTGELKAGDRLMSENELKEMYNVSSTTVRKCIDILRSEDLIERIQGIGTFIKEPQVSRSLEKILSFTKNMQQMGMIPSTKVLAKGIVQNYGEYHKQLDLGREDLVYGIKRLRLGNGEPLMLERRYINLRLCHDIDKYDMSGSLYKIYEEVYHMELKGSRQKLKLQRLGEENAKILGCSSSDPAFIVTGTTYIDNGVCLEYEESLYRGDKYEFFVNVGSG